MTRSLAVALVALACVGAGFVACGGPKFKPPEPNWGSGSSGSSASGSPAGGSSAAGSSAAGSGNTPAGSAGTWRADLQCRDDNCAAKGSDCAPTAPPALLMTHQCGGAEQPPPTREASEQYKRDRAMLIAARRWPCECHCRAADEAEMRDCMNRP